jgi:hypothetical protein
MWQAKNMKRNVLTLALMLCATMGFAQTAFRVPLSSVEAGGEILTFGTDIYRIDLRDQYICVDWHSTIVLPFGRARVVL